MSSSYQTAKDAFFQAIENHIELVNYTTEFTEAFTFGETKHRGFTRKNSNEPYFIHCTAVATSIVQEPDVTKDFVIAALLHDTVEDTDTTSEELKVRFGETVQILVQGLTKLPAEQKEELGKDKYYQEGFFGPIVTVAQTIPFIWKIKLADRLNNLQTLWEYASKAKIEEYLWETKQMFKLSMKVKTALKDQIRDVLQEHYQVS